ncbi:MAG: hypothetical protein IJ167_08650 [Lachnospiraceae bacterium]|nr:hypothetical protein [Lachnospiraceae bacterium]
MNNNLSELELQNLPHLIGGYETTNCKMTAYANEASDPQVKAFFQEAVTSSNENKQTLMKFLH